MTLTVDLGGDARAGLGAGHGYDGWGNLLAKAVTKGTATTLNVAVDPATNRILSGPSYDANGNVTNLPGVGTIAYDGRNRQVGPSTIPVRGYDASNRLIWRKVDDYMVDVDFYLPSGEKLGTYRTFLHSGYTTYDPDNPACTPWVTGRYCVAFARLSEHMYFAGRQIKTEAKAFQPNFVEWTQQDRLGSAVTHLPYGDERTVTAQDRLKLATYWRESSGVDYAQQRYYSSTYGRFLTSDPYRASGGPSDPNSWNRYAYVQGDPVNFVDPRGLEACPASTPTSVTVCATADPVEPYNYWIQGCTNCPSSLPPSQIDYESGSCSNAAGVPCYQVDIDMRKLNQVGVEGCTLSVYITLECGDTSPSRLAVGSVTSGLGRVVGAISAAWWVAAQAVGRAGEQVVASILQLEKNTKMLTGASRIPDFWNVSSRTIYEVKNASNVSFTNQLRDMSAWAISNGYTFQLWINRDTVISSEVQKAVDSGLIILNRFNWP